MFKIFHSNHPLSLMLIPIFLVISKLFIFSDQVQPMIFDTDGYFTALYISFLRSSKFIFYINTLIIYTLQILLIYRISTAYKMLGNYSYLPCFIYLITTSFFPQFAYNIGILLSLFFLLLLINLYMSFFEKDFKNSDLLNMGMILSCGALCYKPFLLFSIIVLFGIISYRASLFKDIFAFLIGLFIPLYFFVSIQYIYTDNLDFGFLQPHFSVFGFSHLKWSVKDIIFLSIFIILGIYSIVKTQTSLLSMLIFNRNIYNVLTLISLSTIVLLFLTEKVDISIFLFWTIPISFMLSYHLKEFKKNRVPELMTWVLMALAVMSHVF